MVVFGCVTKDPWDTGPDTYSGGQYDGSSGNSPEPAFNIAWTDDGNLQASVSNGDNAGYCLGLAETGSGDSGW